ncbi:DUF427 domain-containing protein [Actinomadura flavalba]|uniref:DUF427 domain-containing protein n=1 Tax=Actinomadura flavalba TaxID=1120938 RepID=UPI000476F689|nr:DUF427 domain-containing protein [Actinomadura flavalba]
MTSLRVETSAKRVRAYLAGRLVADTRAPRLVWEHPYYPTYYIPKEDVRAELEPGGADEPHRTLGTPTVSTVRVDGAAAQDAARAYDAPELAGLVRIDHQAMDAWFEEDREVFAHPRDPYKRVDVLPSSRHVRVEVDGVTVAESASPTLLFETGLPVRFYLPKTHVRMDLLEPTRTSTDCPYKGTAEYWTLRTGETAHEDLVWSYSTPLPESIDVAGLVCFDDGRAALFVDGERHSE